MFLSDGMRRVSDTMALPAALTRLFSFTGFAQGLGDGRFAGTQLDTDLDQTNNAVNDVVALLRQVVRSDGKLTNGSVTRNALAADVILGLGASRPWTSGTGYAVNDTVTRGYGLYVALAPSTGVIPGTNATVWALQADLSQAVIIDPGSITTDSYAAKSVTEPKLADGAVSTRSLGDKSVTREKASANFGILPVGAELDFAGNRLPSGWLWCAGQEVSRATYAALFEELTVAFTATSAAGQSVLTNVSYNVAGQGFVGGTIEGPGVQGGVTVLSDNPLTLSGPLTVSGSGTYRLTPYGRGNGSTTFNVPDRRDRVTIGRGSMGGAPIGRLTGVMDTTGLGLARDVGTMQLVNANLPVNMPGGSVTVSYPSYSFDDVTYGGLNSIQSGSGSQFPNIWQNLSQVTRTANPPAPASFTVTTTNTGGGQAFATLQPSSVANKIIFAGV